MVIRLDEVDLEAPMSETIEIRVDEPATLQRCSIVPPPGTANVFGDVVILMRDSVYIRITACDAEWH